VDTSPYRFIVHRETDNNVNFYFDRVLDFILSSDVYEQLGLSFNDLLGMDYASFKIIKKRLDASKEVKDKTLEGMFK